MEGTNDRKIYQPIRIKYSKSERRCEYLNQSNETRASISILAKYKSSKKDSRTDKCYRLAKTEISLDTKHQCRATKK